MTPQRIVQSAVQSMGQSTGQTMGQTTVQSAVRSMLGVLVASVFALTLLTGHAQAQESSSAARETAQDTTLEKGQDTGQATGQDSAQERSELHAFLAALRDHPAILASAAGLEAARAQLAAARDPVQVDLSGGYSRTAANEVDLQPEVPGEQGIQSGAGTLSAGVTLRPHPFGDVADLLEQRETSLAQARLDYRETLTNLQVQALEAALNYRLAERGLEVAEQGAGLALQALESTQARFERGAANESELREARTGYQEAEISVRNARDDLDLARASLETLVGQAPVPDLAELTLPAPSGTSLQVERGRLQLRLASIAPRSERRDLYPTAQASYSWNVTDTSTVGISLESRTLQPNVSYDWQSTERTFPQSEVNGTFQIGVSINIAAGAVDELRAAELQREAAERGLDAARSSAALQEASLENALVQARRSEELAILRLDDARRDLEDAQARLDAGLGIPLDVQSAALSVTQANLELSSARLQVLQSTLNLYEFSATPIVEASE